MRRPNAGDRAGIDERVAPRPKRISRDAILLAIKQHAEKNSITSPTRDMVAEELGIDPSSITRRFGKWERLLAEVGLMPVPLGTRYTDEECYENVLALWPHYGRQPHFAELNQPPSKVGSKAYVRRWGGWRRALAAFVAQVSQVGSEVPLEQDAATNAPQIDTPPQAITPRSIGLALRHKVLLRDKFRCVTCGRSPAKVGNVELHVDHTIPWSRGGQSVESNLRTLCFDCNLGKGNRECE